MRSGSFQSQSQSGSGYQNQSTGGPAGQSSLFVPDPEDHWWPQDLGTPNSLGSQNNVRYAYFANSRRLAVKTGADVWVYDTLDHQIGGFSQQQGLGSSITFTSQFGTVNLGTLPVVSRNGQAVQSNPTPVPPIAPVAPIAPAPAAEPGPFPPTPDSPASKPNVVTESHDIILDAIARLGELRDKGILTDDEFNAKKSDLLSRL